MATVDRRGVSVDATDTPIAGDPNPGLAIKAPVLVATTANITLSGVQTIDGISVGNNNERVLVWQQTDKTTNGLYNASSSNWTRTVDLNSNAQIADGMLVTVTQGSSHANTQFAITSADPIAIGTSNIVFTQAAVNATRNINTTAPLTGGGNLGADLTIAITGSALTLSNDTNVTGSINAGGAAALLGAAQITFGWTGTLSVARGGTGGGVASGTLLDNISGFSATGFLTRAGAGTYAFQSTTNGITNGNLAQALAWTLKGNPTNATANVQDFTVDSLTLKASPASNDELIVWDVAGSAMKKTTVSAVAAGSTVSSVNSATGAITIAAAGGEAVTTSGTTITLASPGGLLNKFRNGAMDIWQRGTAAITVTTAGAYTADGWIVTPTGASCTAQQATNNRSGANALHGLELIGAASVTDITLTQRIESSIGAGLAGKTVTVQAQVFNNTGGSITPTIATKYPTATDNWTSSTGDLAATNLQACGSGAWTQVCYTLSVSANATAGYEFIFDFGNNFSSNAKDVIVAELDVRVTPGVTTGQNSNPPPPELRPLFTEMTFCQRYFQTSYPNGTAPGAANTADLVVVAGVSTSGNGTGLPLQVPMRASSGTVVFYDGAGTTSKCSLYGSGAWTNGETFLTFLQAGVRSIWFTSTNTNTFGVHYTISSEL